MRSQEAEVLDCVPGAVVGLARLLGREMRAERVVLLGLVTKSNIHTQIVRVEYNKRRSGGGSGLTRLWPG